MSLHSYLNTIAPFVKNVASESKPALPSTATLFYECQYLCGIYLWVCRILESLPTALAPQELGKLNRLHKGVVGHVQGL